MATYVRRTGDSDTRDLANRTASDTYPVEPVGTIVWLPTQEGTMPLALRYIYNGEASTDFAAKDVVVAKTSATTIQGVSYHAYHLGVGVLGGANAVAMLVLGIARYAINNGEYGYVTCGGRCTATAAGAISAGVRIITAASGDVDTVGSSDGALVIGFCVTAAGGAGDVDMYLCLPNVQG